MQFLFNQLSNVKNSRNCLILTLSRFEQYVTYLLLDLEQCRD